jgi:hypothetical protein
MRIVLPLCHLSSSQRLSTALSPLSTRAPPGDMPRSGIFKENELAIIRRTPPSHGHETRSFIFRGHKAAFADDAPAQALLVPVEGCPLPWSQTRIASSKLHVPLSQVGATHLGAGRGVERGT